MVYFEGVDGCPPAILRQEESPDFSREGGS